MINYEKIRNYTQKDFLKSYDQYRAFIKFLFPDPFPFKTICITGSSGKGTTAQTIHSILYAHGCSAGLYTSPHLRVVHERIRTGSGMISEKDFSRIKRYINNKVRAFNSTCNLNYEPTFFELLTAMALRYFMEEKVEYAVLEVGLGGRLDATNISTPVLAFLLPVSWDHTQFLGRKKSSILKEKQELIRNNTIVVTGIQERSLLKILQRKCKQTGSPLFILNRDFFITGKKLRKDFWHFTYRADNRPEKFLIPCTGISIPDNIGLVLYGLSRIMALNPVRVRNCLRKIHYPGRFEVIKRRGRRIILDGGHNPVAVDSFCRTVRAMGIKDLKLIFTIMSDKKALPVLKALARVSRVIILTRINNAREFDLNILVDLCRKYFIEIYVTKDLKSAMALFPDNDMALTGSFYLVSEFYKIKI